MVSWIRYRDTYCDFTNKADDLPNFGGMALHLSFCKRRLNEQKVIELEKVVSHIDNL